MSEERLISLIQAPHISEKASLAAENRREFVFQVLSEATKAEIKKAIELLFGVKVEKVTTLSVKGKRKNFGRISGKRKSWKKAYVTLAEGQDIDFTVAAQ